MILGSVARRYARALIEIGAAQNTMDPLGTELNDLAHALTSSKELMGVLASPRFPMVQRRKVLEGLLDRSKSSRTARSFFLLLLERDRMASLPDIAREYGVMADERAGRIRAHVTSARPMNDADLGRVRTTLERVTAKKIVMTSSVDDGLIGGTVTKVGDILYDGSVRTALDSLRQRLTQQG
jgi:F-type H+-transporting ATPase subunit delta